MLIMFVVPPVVRLVTTMLLDDEAETNARLNAELVAVIVLMGAATVPPLPESVSAPFLSLIVLDPPPATMVLATTAPPLTLMMPALPGVRVPGTAAKVSVLLTVSVRSEEHTSEL